MVKFGFVVFGLAWCCLLSGASAQMEGHAVGDQICVEGYVMDDFCIQRKTLLDNPSAETLVSPFLHSVHCLVDVPPCFNSPFNILVDPEEEDEDYKIGYYISDNQPLIDFAQSVRSDIPVGLRLVVMGTVGESVLNDQGVLQHFMTSDEIIVAEEGMGCPPEMAATEATMAPTMFSTVTGTMNATYMGTMMGTANVTIVSETDEE